MSDYNFKVAKIYLLYLIVPLVIKQGLKAMGDSNCLNLCLYNGGAYGITRTKYRRASVSILTFVFNVLQYHLLK